MCYEKCIVIKLIRFYISEFLYILLWISVFRSSLRYLFTVFLSNSSHQPDIPVTYRRITIPCRLIILPYRLTIVLYCWRRYLKKNLPVHFEQLNLMFVVYFWMQRCMLRWLKKVTFKNIGIFEKWRHDTVMRRHDTVTLVG